MGTQLKFRLIVGIFLLIMAIIFIFGVPYNRFTWSNSVAAQPYTTPEQPIVLPLLNGQMPPLITITCGSTPVYDSPGGSAVVKDGLIVQVVAGSRWFLVGNPVADKSGRLWQAIFVGGPQYPFIPLGCIR